MWRIGALLLVLVLLGAAAVWYGLQAGILEVVPKSKIEAQEKVWDSYRSTVNGLQYPNVVDGSNVDQAYYISLSPTLPVVWKATKPVCEDWQDDRYRCLFCEFRILVDEEVGTVGDGFELLAFIAKEPDGTGIQTLTLKANDSAVYENPEISTAAVRRGAEDFSSWCRTKGYGYLEVLADTADDVGRAR